MNAASFKRSRAGCDRCREKKLKCDEAKPTCLQCEKRRVRCPGYHLKIRWSSKYEMPTSLHSDRSDTRRRSASSERSCPSRRRQSSSADPARRPIETWQAVPSPSAEEQNLGSVSSAGGRLSPPSSRRDSVRPDNSKLTPPALRPQDAHQPDISEPTLNQDRFHNDNCSWDGNYDGYEADPGLEDNSVGHDMGSDQDNEQQTFPNPVYSAESESTASMSSHLDLMAVANQPGTPGASPLTLFTQAQNNPVALVEYYFEELCPFHSIADDPSNPFRYLVSRYLNSSPLIYNCVIYMSATHLLHRRDDMAARVINYHSSAVKSMSSALSALETTESGESSKQLQEVLFASILLGLTTPWSNPRDLGVPHLLGARKLCQRWLKALVGEGHDLPQLMLDPENSFLIGAMAHWETCISFVIDQTLDSVEYLLPFTRECSVSITHPFTGIATPLIINFARLGICVRQQRVLDRVRSLGWEKEMYQQKADEIGRRVASIEEFTVGYHIPSSSQVQGIHCTAQVLHRLECFAQINKLALFLELYRSFPQVLSRRVEVEKGLEMVSPGVQNGIGCSRSSKPHKSDMGDSRRFIHDIASNIVSLLTELPEKHASDLYLTTALIVCGSVLAKPDKDLSGSPASLMGQLDAIAMRPWAVEQCRQALRERSLANAKLFCIGKIFAQAGKLLDKVWEWLDNDCAPVAQLESTIDHFERPFKVHWIDVMVEYKLESVFG